MVLLPPCLLAQTCDEEVQALRWLEKADATLNAREALKNGNQKLMAVYGFTLYIPGVEGKQAKSAYDDGNYIAIEGTTDALCSEEHGKLNSLALNYAESYNQVLLRSN